MPDVSGEISLAIDKLTLPLDGPKEELVKNVTMEGRLNLHRISAGVSGPLRHLMVRVLADMHGKKPSDVVRVTKNTEVRFRVQEGRMHHEGLKIGFPDISPDLVATSRGSVGLDKSLDMYLEIPRILANGMIDPAAEKLGPVRFRVTGTFEKPVVTEIKDPPKK